MASTPKKIKVELDQSTIDRIREEGRVDGVKQGRQDFLDWLEDKYLRNAERPDRDTPEAAAILTLAREASDYFKKLRKV